MRNDDLYNGITDIEDELVEGAAKSRKKRPRWWVLVSVVAAVLVLVVGVTVFLPRGGGEPTVGGELHEGGPSGQGGQSGQTSQTRTLAAAVYPERTRYPEDYDSDDWDTTYERWREEQRACWAALDAYDGSLDNFFGQSMAQFLSDTEGENRVCSPLNVYMALAMLAETTGGNSRAQILELLGVDSMDTLRRQVSELWTGLYRDDGQMRSVLGNSIWLRQGMPYNQTTMDTLARQYYASSFQGVMGTEEMNRALQQWINEQTEGMLKEQASGLELAPETVLALASTICFKARWTSEFWEDNTSPEVFHSPNGDVTCDFLHQTVSNTYFWGDHFSAVRKSLAQGEAVMWFILPDKGVKVESLLRDEQLLNQDWEAFGEEVNRKHLKIHLSIPKFDVVSDEDLSGDLKKLGLIDVFDPQCSDFSPLTDEVDGMFVSKVNHAARVTIDEEGCEAAAYTVLAMGGSAGPPENEEEVDFTLDRPFLFVISSRGGLPLFAGIVNQP